MRESFDPLIVKAAPLSIVIPPAPMLRLELEPAF
jgi:hypothetical protein